MSVLSFWALNRETTLSDVDRKRKGTVTNGTAVNFIQFLSLIAQTFKGSRTKKRFDLYPANIIVPNNRMTILFLAFLGR